MSGDAVHYGSATRFLTATFTVLLTACAPANVDWNVYGGSVAADRYSPLKQIDAHNVQTLRQVWRFDMNETGDSQTNPLIIDGTLYAMTPALRVVALNAATGAQRWAFDSGATGRGPSRGLAYWRNGNERRLFAGAMNLLFALDPASGKPVESFGDAGRIDLCDGLAGDRARCQVALTSPGVIYRDLLIVGFRTGETRPAPPGDIRAFDVRSGKLRWTFHTIPAAGEAGADTWPPDARSFSGAANNWSGLSLDAKRGVVYVPTGSAVSDFYGADRPGANLYANTLLALDAATGRRLWHFQTVHHDILDRDLPTAPSLTTIEHEGRRREVVVQPTKQGFVFVFDRETGQPVFPIEERPVPASEVPGEKSWPTQPHASVPAPLARQHLTDDLLTTRTAAAHEWARQQFAGMRSEGPFTPPGISRPSIVFPGYDGGAEWGGAALDRHGVLYINVNDIAWTAQLQPTAALRTAGEALYQMRCAVCHGAQREGSPPAFPSLVGIAGRLTDEQIVQIVHTGRGRMPAFTGLAAAELKSLLDYLHDPSVTAGDKKEMMTMATNAPPYTFTGYHKFLDPDGYPAVAPPWGTLNAVDLNTGRTRWRIPLGEYPELTAQGLAATGSENYGGPIVTASDLLFIGATMFDSKFRVFDTRDGSLLWETRLPFAGIATPATYMVDGKQYVVIYSSNARNKAAPQGAAYVAFALP